MTNPPASSIPEAGAFSWALTFDDVLLVPQRSAVLPGEVRVEGRLTRRITLPVPLVSSPMDTVTEAALAVAMADAGGLGIIHKNLSVEVQSAEVRGVKTCGDTPAEGACLDERGRRRVGAAVGVGEYERLEALLAEGVDVVVIDSAHGHSERVLETVREAHRRYDVELVVGNIATAEAARDLIDAGADGLRVGVGPGSICTTRVVSGCGVPQLTAILETCRAARPSGVPVMADGGMRSSGDIVKALAAGANCVILGSLLAGVDEAPGEVVMREGRKFKAYRGMGSAAAMRQGSVDRYEHGAAGAGGGKVVPEGVEALVPYRGPVRAQLFRLVGGLRSGMGYCGAATIDALHQNAKFYRVTVAGAVESHPHDVVMDGESPDETYGVATGPA